MDDVIYRRAAIDALEREKTYCTAYKDGYSKTDVFKQYNMGLTDGIKAIKALPSAQPDYDLSDYSDRLWKAAYERGKAEAEPRWIPVTERLPEKHEEVLATVAGEIVIAWLYLDGRWRSNDCPETYLNDHITAWRELPEPYREETEDATD